MYWWRLYVREKRGGKEEINSNDRGAGRSDFVLIDTGQEAF